MFPSLSTTSKSHEMLETSHSRTRASIVVPFSSLVCMQTQHLAMKQLLKVAELEICLLSMKTIQGEALSSIHAIGV